MRTFYQVMYLSTLLFSAIPSFAVSGITSDSAVSILFPVRVNQQKIADCDFKSSKPVNAQGVQMIATPGGDVTISGRDRSSLLWTATYEATPGAGCQLWRVDLGRNGQLDLAFLEFGANSSGGWDTTLSLLLFDEKGSPFPWQATSKFTSDGLGIRELVKLGDEQRPVVIDPQRRNDIKENPTEYHAYGFSGDRVLEILGEYGDKSWPLMIPSGVLDSSAPRTSESLSTTTLLHSQTLQENQVGHHFLGLKGNSEYERQVVFSDGSMTMPKILIVDTASERRIISSPQPSDFLNVKRANLITTVLGQDCGQATCSPLIMWMK
jgi:hypothetical protein